MELGQPLKDAQGWTGDHHLVALVLSLGWTCSLWDQLGCPRQEVEPVEGLVAMNVLKGPRCHQPQSHNGTGAAPERCSGMDGVSIMWCPWCHPLAGHLPCRTNQDVLCGRENLWKGWWP